MGLRSKGGTQKGGGKKYCWEGARGGPRGIWTVFGVEESIFAGFEPQMDGFDGLLAFFETPQNLADFGQKKKGQNGPKMAIFGPFWAFWGLL